MSEQEIQEITAEQYAAADEAWLDGTGCIGCQGIGEETDWAGYCDGCLEQFDAPASTDN